MSTESGEVHFLVDVSGDSMEPTICDGDSALVDETHRSPRSGKIYALQAGDGPLDKRVRKRDHRWWADSDNDKHEPQACRLVGAHGNR